MPVTGGLGDPIIFLAAMGIVSGAIQAFLSILGLGFKMSFFMALASIIFVPLMVVIARASQQQQFPELRYQR